MFLASADLPAPIPLVVSHKQPQSELGIDYRPIIQALGRLGRKELEYKVRFDYIELLQSSESIVAVPCQEVGRGRKEGRKKE